MAQIPTQKTGGASGLSGPSGSSGLSAEPEFTLSPQSKARGRFIKDGVVHCGNGHALVDDNIVFVENGVRCRECMRIYRKRYGEPGYQRDPSRKRKLGSGAYLAHQGANRRRIEAEKAWVEGDMKYKLKHARRGRASWNARATDETWVNAEQVYLHENAEGDDWPYGRQSSGEYDGPYPVRVAYDGSGGGSGGAWTELMRIMKWFD